MESQFQTQSEVVRLVQKLYNEPLNPEVIRPVSSIMVVPVNANMEPAVLDIAGIQEQESPCANESFNTLSNVDMCGVEDSIIFIPSHKESEVSVDEGCATEEIPSLLSCNDNISKESGDGIHKDSGGASKTCVKMQINDVSECPVNDDVWKVTRQDDCKRYVNKKSTPSSKDGHLKRKLCDKWLDVRKKMSVNVTYINVENNHTLVDTGDPMSRLLKVDEARSLLTQEYVSSVLSALDADLSYSIFDEEKNIKVDKVDVTTLSPRLRAPFDSEGPPPSRAEEPTPVIQILEATSLIPTINATSVIQLMGTAPVIQTVEGTPVFQTMEGTPVIQTMEGTPVIRTMEGTPVIRTMEGAPVIQTMEGTPVIQTIEGTPVIQTIEGTPVIQLLGADTRQIIKIENPLCIQDLEDEGQDAIEIPEDGKTVNWKRLPNNLCRVCAKTSKDLTHVFSAKGDHLHLADLIHTHLPILVTPDDLLPLFVCASCISRLMGVASLVNTCVESDSTLRTLLELAQGASVEAMLQEGDDILYNSCAPEHSFPTQSDVEAHVVDDPDVSEEPEVLEDTDETEVAETVQVSEPGAGAEAKSLLQPPSHKEKEKNSVEFSQILSKEDVVLINKMKREGLKVTLVRVPNLENLTEDKKDQRVMQVLRTMNTSTCMKKKPIGTISLKTFAEEPAKPTEPENCAETAKPDEPENCAEAAKPDEPAYSCEPAMHAEPAKPAEPAEPAELPKLAARSRSLLKRNAQIFAVISETQQPGDPRLASKEAGVRSAPVDEQQESNTAVIQGDANPPSYPPRPDSTATTVTSLSDIASSVLSKDQETTNATTDASKPIVPSVLRTDLMEGINRAIRMGQVAKTGTIIKLNGREPEQSPSSVYVYVRNKDCNDSPQLVPQTILDLEALDKVLEYRKGRVAQKLAAKAARHQAAIARRRARVREKRRLMSEKRALTCAQCGVMFKTKEEVQIHYLEHLKCRFCDKQFTRRPNLKEHERVHTKEKPYICDQCGRAFRTRAQMMQHHQRHNGDTPYMCQICGKRYSVRNTYLAHVARHSTEAPYLCEMCGKCFKVQVALRLHRLSHQNCTCPICDKVFSYRSYQIHKRLHEGDDVMCACSYCGKKFLTVHRLKIHLLIHEATYPFSCGVCKRAFKRMTHLQAHQGRHTPEQLEDVLFFCCAICHIQFEQPSMLSQHLKSHSEEERQALKSYRCDTCNKCFSIERELRTHELRHVGKQTFSCSTCNSAFDTKREFDAHSDSHTEERPFACEVCGKRFRTLINLNSHQQIHLAVKPYPCQSCSKKFKTINGLNQHKVVHSDIRKHMCSICNMGFKRRDAMKNHERTHFAERPYSCSVCGRAFKVKADCSTHLKRHREAGIEGSIMESCYSCPVCSATFTLKVELSSHVQNAHDLEVAVLDKDDNLVLVPEVEIF